MHVLTFQTKRSHLCALAMGRKLFAGRLDPASGSDEIPDMTPARFDLLFVIQAAGGVLAQSLLRKQLDLHPTTISKAVKRLAQLGFVRSQPDPADARCRRLALTKKGRLRLASAVQRLNGGHLSGHLRRFAMRFVARCAKSELTRRAGAELREICQRALDLSRHLGDRSHPVYELH